MKTLDVVVGLTDAEVTHLTYYGDTNTAVAANAVASTSGSIVAAFSCTAFSRTAAAAVSNRRHA